MTQGEICGDNRFEIIAKYKKALIDGTNIETRPEEMAVIDDILFRFWQMGWLEQHRWISVEDERPRFIDIVLYCDEDGEYYTDIDNIGEDVKITHWMRIPDCPPLQDFNNKLRAVLDGENEKGGSND